ncbi:phosphoribosyltransferase [Aquipuribacter sp. MA13-6]|uniref:phosphoribosyltransferase n=1 Tax=unclassified Aquipuribacter TaxID=2635084 RepID=UPI003EEE0FF7
MGRRPGRWRDRAHAGALLAERLVHTVGPEDDVVVVGLPRGGVVVAAPVARALRAPLDVVVVRKLGVPWQPEVAFGAVGEGGVEVLNPDVVAAVPADQVDAVRAREQAEVDRRARAWRGAGTGPDLGGRTVVVVDDGVATGATARAAVQVLRARGVARLVLATPVVARGTAAWLRRELDDLVALREPGDLGSVGAWFDDFTQVPEAEVRSLLERDRGEAPGT